MYKYVRQVLLMFFFINQATVTLYSHIVDTQG